MPSTLRRFGAALSFACVLAASTAAVAQPAAQTQPAAATTQTATPQMQPATPLTQRSTSQVEQPRSAVQDPSTVVLPGATPPNAPLDAPVGTLGPGEVAPLPNPGGASADGTRKHPNNLVPVWGGLREADYTTGTVNNFFGSEGQRGVLIQMPTQYLGSDFATAGEAWRQARNSRILPYGAALLLITLVALAMFYFAKGTIKVHEPPTGRLIERFTYFERASHWINAIAFCILAVSGLFIAFGRDVILPLMNDQLFGWITYGLKNIHNFVGPVFAVTLAVMFFAYLRDNWPRKHDINWLKKGGGLLTGKHVPSHRFNAGEKIVFWGGVLFLGSIVTASGFVLNKIVPGMDYTRGTMQVAHMVHGVATILMVAMIMAHIYLGTIGMAGAYRAMRDGYVDESWAKEHHEYWWRDIKDGKIPAQRTPTVERTKRPVPQT